MNLYTKNEIHTAITNFLKSYINEHTDLKSVKKYFTNKNNFQIFLNDINHIHKNKFENTSDYNEYMKKELFDTINDLIADQKDKNKNENMKIKFYNDYLNENFYIPNVKLTQFLNNVKPLSEKSISSVETYYKTYRQYIDVVNKTTHLLKVNDISGDILNNNRVILNIYVFNSNDIDIIRDNIVSYCMTSFYSELPEQITIFGASISPVYVINKEDLKKIIESKITKDLTVKIIATITGYSYAGVGENDNFIFRSDNI